MNFSIFYCWSLLKFSSLILLVLNIFIKRVTYSIRISSPVIMIFWFAGVAAPLVDWLSALVLWLCCDPLYLGSCLARHLSLGHWRMWTSFGMFVSVHLVCMEQLLLLNHRESPSNCGAEQCPMSLMLQYHAHQISVAEEHGFGNDHSSVTVARRCRISSSWDRSPLASSLPRFQIEVYSQAFHKEGSHL